MSWIRLQGEMGAPQRLLLATSNRHKVAEMTDVLSSLGVEVLGLGDFSELSDIKVEENGLSFLDNARIKALAYGKKFEGWTLAEDSGLCVAALDGGPGVRSARYGDGLGPNAPKDDAERTALLLKESTGKADRRAWYVSAMCLVEGERILCEVEGRVDGLLSTAILGEGGFGYDPLFMPEGYDQTYAQLPASVKADTSHRSKAIQALLKAMKDLAA